MKTPSNHMVEVVGEEIKWSSKPALGPWIFTKIIGSVFTFFFFLFFGIFFLVAAIKFIQFFIVIATLALIVVGYLIIAGFWIYRTYKHAEYGATNKSLVAFSGFIGRDYSQIKWENVQDFEVNVGIADKIFGTGTITAVTAGTGGVQFKFLKKPYKVLNILQELNQKHSEE